MHRLAMTLGLTFVAYLTPAPEAPTPAPTIEPVLGMSLRILKCFEIVASLPYARDPEDYWQSPRETQQWGYGDCEDKAIFLHQLLRDAGIDGDVVFGVTNWDEAERLHSWVEILVSGETYVLDPTQGFLGRRSSIAPGCHVPIIGMPKVVRKMRDYAGRNGPVRLNRYYDPLVPAEERIATR